MILSASRWKVKKTTVSTSLRRLSILKTIQTAFWILLTRMKTGKLHDPLLSTFMVVDSSAAVPRPCRSAVLALSGLAAIIGTTAAALDEAGELVEKVLVGIGVFALVPFSPELSALVCPPVGLGGRLPFGRDLVAVVEAEGQGVVSDDDNLLDLLAESVLIKFCKAQHLGSGVLEHLLRYVF